MSKAKYIYILLRHLYPLKRESKYPQINMSYIMAISEATSYRERSIDDTIMIISLLCKVYIPMSNVYQ